jgi:hypothetical protein
MGLDLGIPIGRATAGLMPLCIGWMSINLWERNKENGAAKIKSTLIKKFPIGY